MRNKQFNKKKEARGLRFGKSKCELCRVLNELGVTTKMKPMLLNIETGEIKRYEQHQK
ncbi:MAG: hypothetical protein ACTSQE_06715 [Candidatus Heimdallarchaeaceae archaeon]